MTMPTNHVKADNVSIAETSHTKGICQRALRSIKLCMQSNLQDSILGNLKNTYVSSELTK